MKNDRVPVDPRKYEVTYVNLDQSFTANLADGAGFVPGAGQRFLHAPLLGSSIVGLNLF